MNNFFIENYNKIVGWGTSKYYFENKEKFDGILHYFVDSNQSKWGKLLDGIPICNPNKVTLEDLEDTLVIIFSSYYKEIEKKLQEFGVKYYISAYELSLLMSKDIITNIEPLIEFSKQKKIGTISRNNFTLYLGGTSKLIREQMETFISEGYDHIHFYWKHMSLKGLKGDLYFVVINGSDLYLIEEKVFENYINELDVLIIHNLIDLDKLKMNDILNNKLSKNAKVFHYLHDFSLVCSNIKLTYNDQYFCESYKDDYNICNSCEYYYGHVENYNFYKEFFKKNSSIKLISPSENTKKIYKSIFPEIKNEIIILPHQTYFKGKKRKKPNSKIRIAYVGNKDKFKGWETFKRIVSKYKGDFEFYCFGYSDEVLDSVTYVDVSFIKDGHLAMTRALEKHSIDISLLWSIWPETYSYTYFESSSANCFIITNSQSGNIAQQVLNNNNGIVFESDNELTSFLDKQSNVKQVISNNDVFLQNIKQNNLALLGLINE